MRTHIETERPVGCQRLSMGSSYPVPVRHIPKCVAAVAEFLIPTRPQYSHRRAKATVVPRKTPG
ncbi:hypothetical protein J2Y68_002700 [Paenarthrobacter nitroguajacolicus]|nr:hypothetical protein [Paenarthrobacter nitroguajacolicus]